MHVVILDDDGNELPIGETGWIHVVPAFGDRFHYRNNPDATAAVTAATRFGPAVTGGDLGHLDADGYLYVTDRSAELVVRGGVNIYPRESEDALHTHPAVVDCAAFGVPDDVYGERLVALVELAPGSTITRDELDRHVRRAPRRVQVPRGDPDRGVTPPRSQRQGSQGTAPRPGPSDAESSEGSDHPTN